MEILAMEMATDIPSTFQDKSCIKMVGYDMSKKAADKVFEKSGNANSFLDVFVPLRASWQISYIKMLNVFNLDLLTYLITYIYLLTCLLYTCEIIMV